MYTEHVFTNYKKNGVELSDLKNFNSAWKSQYNYDKFEKILMK